MKSIRRIYKIGHGPSSSHTVGPFRAASLFRDRYPEADHFEVTLYGSLAFTGEGHGTGKAILSAIPGATIIFDKKEMNLPHPNTMLFRALKSPAGAERENSGSFDTAADGERSCSHRTAGTEQPDHVESDSVRDTSQNRYVEIGSARIMSIGGGSIEIEGEGSEEDAELYPQKNFSEILAVCESEGLSLSEFIFRTEGSGLREMLLQVWHTMEDCVERGLAAEGILPGGLGITRKAKMLYEKRCHNESSEITMERTLAAYAFAVNEENADEHIVVTAPTCGSCGVIPSIFYYMCRDKGFREDEIIDALAVAALIGDVIQTNASISGAECGCQAEIGSACSMAAGALASLYGLNNKQIEYAAEVAMEHHLGLTCDPVNGLVQIPCIERNAVAAMRAVNAVNISRFLYETRRISLDQVIETMYRTGLDLNEKYRETAHGGLAVIYR